MGQDKDETSKNSFPWKEFLSFLGIVIVAYFGYLGIRSQIEIPIRATQTAEAILSVTTKITDTPIKINPTFTGSPMPIPTNTFTFTPTSTPIVTIKSYKNVSTGLCLDSNIDGQVYTLGCNGEISQNWDRQGLALINVATKLCLDSNIERQVYTLSCNGGDYQDWDKLGLVLVNKATGLCLDSNADGEVYTLECNGGNFQNWK